ncbi:MAG: TrmH family RNA methyltransferase [Candidatus Gracilibacteria bacterium]
MITKAQIHFVKDLHARKQRLTEKLFFCEGTKGVKELLATFELHSLFTTASWVEKEESTLVNIPSEKIFLSEGKELERMSALKTAQDVIAVFHIPDVKSQISTTESTLILALDHISDPGNLGTIIRTADWYGIDTILCSEDTVDVWSPKVVQATMGSLGRVHLHYTDLKKALSEIQSPVFTTAMTGASIQTFDFPESCVLLMGNESVGVSEQLTALSTSKLHIPAYRHKNPANGQAESLNVAIATGIVLQAYRGKHSH